MRWLVPLVLGSAILCSTPAFAGPVDDVEPAVDALLAARQEANDRRAVRTLTRLSKALDRAISRDLPYAKQVRALIATARLADRKFADEASLVDAVTMAGAAIEDDLGDAQRALDALVTAADAGTVDLRRFGKRRGLSIRSLKKAQRGAAKALARALAAESAPRGALARKFAQLARAATLLDSYRGQEGITGSWVLTSIRLATSQDGSVDLDGDGTGDNQAASLVSIAQLLGVDVNEAIGGLFGAVDPGLGVPVVPVIQMWGFDAYAADPFVFAGFLSAADNDGDIEDNASGTETLTATPGALAGDGHPMIRTVTQFDAGAVYSLLAQGEGIELAGFAVPAGVPFGIAGTATATSNNGVIGFALPTDQLVALVEGQLGGGVNASILAALVNLADIDTDGDRRPDALSFALAFEGSPCQLVVAE